MVGQINGIDLDSSVEHQWRTRPNTVDKANHRAETEEVVDTHAPGGILTIHSQQLAVWSWKLLLSRPREISDYCFDGSGTLIILKTKSIHSYGPTSDRSFSCSMVSIEIPSLSRYVFANHTPSCQKQVNKLESYRGVP